MRGSGATGNNVNAAAPHNATPSVNNVVATGRLMKGAEMFTPDPPPSGASGSGVCTRPRQRAAMRSNAR